MTFAGVWVEKTQTETLTHGGSLRALRVPGRPAALGARSLQLAEKLVALLVHLRIIAVVGLAARALHPLRMVAIPLHRLAQARFPLDLVTPVERAAGFAGIHRI